MLDTERMIKEVALALVFDKEEEGEEVKGGFENRDESDEDDEEAGASQVGERVGSAKPKPDNDIVCPHSIDVHSNLDTADKSTYQSFHINNRDLIVWWESPCMNFENGMGWILRKLARDRQTKTLLSDTMDVDEAKPEAPGSTVKPKRTVDLESIAFSLGGNLMSNKK
ncbi:hypothetical protein ARMSODRAFT_1085224 [Armillaria solidipes]|uniref:Uncharacterized protein n=1 Tax=Armillaria solidipes TaxID=1076256 RepID=A0A2H3BD37_9AGAR|nr:hypothetical protein ARMSODRAFT_1085224 [Armillaria solidipes]